MSARHDVLPVRPRQEVAMRLAVIAERLKPDVLLAGAGRTGDMETLRPIGTRFTLTLEVNDCTDPYVSEVEYEVVGYIMVSRGYRVAETVEEVRAVDVRRARTVASGIIANPPTAGPYPMADEIWR